MYRKELRDILLQCVLAKLKQRFENYFVVCQEQLTLVFVRKLKIVVAFDVAEVFGNDLAKFQVGLLQTVPWLFNPICWSQPGRRAS